MSDATASRVSGNTLRGPVWNRRAKRTHGPPRPSFANDSGNGHACMGFGIFAV